MKRLYKLLKYLNKSRDYAFKQYSQNKDQKVKGAAYYALTVLLNELRWLCEFKVILPTRSGECVKVNLLNFKKFYLPYIWEGSFGTRLHKVKLKEIYTLENVIEPEEGDVIVDVGAYLGTFSIMYASIASKIIAVDPNASYSKCLELNTQEFSNISVESRALWNKSEKLVFNLSLTPNDNSVLSADEHSLSSSIEVDAIRIDQLASELGIEKIDFLKVEAEGVEPEILEGIGDLTVKKISVNCGPERHGESPIKEVLSILESKGYTCIVKPNKYWRGEMVYAHKS